MSTPDHRHETPDRDYIIPLKYGLSQINTEMGIERGTVQWFMVQLEANAGARYGDRDWKQVARFDHHPDSDWGHDIVEEGLHLDLYRNGRKKEVRYRFPRVRLRQAPGYCENYLQKEVKSILSKYGPEDVDY